MPARDPIHIPGRAGLGPKLRKAGGWFGKRCLAQEMPGPQQGGERRGGIDRRGGVGFAELAPGGIDDYRQMRIGRNREPEGLEQKYLARCGGRQIGPCLLYTSPSPRD